VGRVSGLGADFEPGSPAKIDEVAFIKIMSAKKLARVNGAHLEVIALPFEITFAPWVEWVGVHNSI